MQAQYTPNQIEADAQRDWEDHQYFAAKEDPRKEKFYCLSMFPYPSGRLHMGHVRNYSIGDAIARYQHMQGKNVLQPIGWDAFGLPAENAAIEHKVPPAQWTHDNINAMRAQLKQLGFAYDWSRELATCEPEYYRWEQWLFLQLYQKGLAYKKNAVVNWDPVDNTVLANEQVVDGRGWRSGALIERREISQWFIKITAYADALLRDLDTLTGWPEQVRSMQRHWIGRSEGVNVTFDVDLPDSEPLQIFTTRVDTIMGASFIGISAEHPLAQHAAQSRPDIQTFVESCRHQKTAEAELATQEKRGIDSGLVAIHPLTQEKLPIWIANFVLMEYGTGAVMAVPAHDTRDYEFATKYNLPIKQVLEAGPDDDITQAAFTHKNKLIHSEEFSGLDFEQAVSAITGRLIELGKGEREVHYRLRDWGVSRQRYWGTPIPIIYCDQCGAVPVPETDLPVILPTDVTPKGTGSPLTKLESFYQTTCPRCQGAATRETDTFDTFVESSWYYARYACPDLDTAILDKRANYWTPVDQYIGGIEHAVMHLLYARFFHKVLRDEGFVESDEPMTNLLTQGMVLKDGSKMSKSKGNTVDPADLIEKYGADTVRLFTLFAAPPEQSLEWSDSGVEGGYRFLKRLWRAVYEHVQQQGPCEAYTAGTLDDAAQTLRREVHKTLTKVSDDIGKRLTFNTAIAANMELINTLSKYTDDADTARAVRQEALESIVLMLAPIVPHITHTLWHTLGHEEAVIRATWPTADVSALQQDTLELVVQINGKRRSQIAVASDADQATIEALVMNDPKVQQHLDGKAIKKIIVVPKRLVNVVAA